MTAITVRAFDSLAETLGACAAAIEEAIRRSAAPQFVLAGGQTPRGVYALLAGSGRSEALPWADVEFWFGDERCVGPDHPKSNYRLAQETLLKPLGVPVGHVHRMLGELGAEEGARRYRERLVERLGSAPRIDLALVGMGAEGHTLSLFPGAAGLTSPDLAVAALVPAAPRERISLTPLALGHAERIFLLVTGAAKRDAVGRALSAADRDPAVPTSFLRGLAETVLFCDRAALP